MKAIIQLPSLYCDEIEGDYMCADAAPPDCNTDRAAQTPRIFEKNAVKEQQQMLQSRIIVMKQFPEPIGVKWTRCVACRLLVTTP